MFVSSISTFLVIVNMYIAIILDNFDDILQQDESGISLGDFEEFYSVWAGYDPKATQFVTLQKLSNLLDDLKPPFQIPKPNEVSHCNLMWINWMLYSPALRQSVVNYQGWLECCMEQLFTDKAQVKVKQTKQKIGQYASS